jgi:TolB-like protein/class 3 adenylate cyclase
LSSEPVERRLAAILAADVVGSCRLMGADEEGTLAQLKALRKSLVDPKIAEHRGRIVKNTGDGALVEFASVVDAVRCAVKIQCGMAEQNIDVPQVKRIEFRIGIHVGDIIFDDNDIFGDGVNIAARLEGIAEPGGVFMSDDAYRQIRGKVEIACDDMGPQPLKNIAEPMRAWRVRTTGQLPSGAPPRALVSAPQVLALPDKPSIAVLPFHNMSGDAEQQYLCDGLAEEIIIALSRIRALFVIARNSSFTYRGKEVDVRQIGRELGVRYVMQGSVRRAGNRLRIAGQLARADSGANIWADRFDGGMDDIFSLQDEITVTIVGAIAPRVEQAEIERATFKATESLNAYDEYLRGLTKFYAATSKQEFEDALRKFRSAIALDPSFASPYGLASRCYNFRKAQGWMVDRMQETAEAVGLARKALELAKDDVVALSEAGYALAYVGRDLDAAASALDRAIELNPSSANSWHYRGMVGVWLGETLRTIEYVSRAMRLSPVDPLMYEMKSNIAHGYLHSNEFEAGAQWAERALSERPVFGSALRVAAACYGLAGRKEEARGVVDRLLEADPALRVSNLRERLGPYRLEVSFARYEQGLRLAGVPE